MSLQRLLLSLVMSLCTAHSAEVETSIPDEFHSITRQSNWSIWTPVPRYRNFFVIGQYLSSEDRFPPAGTEIIVGRSVNGSLAEPLGFFGGWKIAPGVYVHSMLCPSGYVSLGSIATRGQHRPDKGLYRCVTKQATMEAKLNQIIHSSPNGFTLSTITSQNGWKSVFYLLTYPPAYPVNIQPYTLKQISNGNGRERNLIKIVEPADLPKDSSTVASSIPAKTKNESLTNVSGANGEIITVTGSAVFALLVLFAAYFLVLKNSRRKKANAAATSSGYRSGANDEHEVALQRVGSIFDLYANSEAEVRNNVVYDGQDTTYTKKNELYVGYDSGYCYGGERADERIVVDICDDSERIYAIPSI